MPKVSQTYRDARRQQIIDAAIACFARDGFHQASMADIVRESGLSAGAIYGYFPGKDEIIVAVAEDRHRQEAELNAAALGRPDPVAALRGLARAYAEWMFDPAAEPRRRLGVQGWAEALRSPAIRDLVVAGMEAAKETLATLIRRAQATGRISRAFEAEALARAMVALFQGFALQLAWDPRVDHQAHLAVVEQLLDAITGDAG